MWESGCQPQAVKDSSAAEGEQLLLQSQQAAGLNIPLLVPAKGMGENTAAGEKAEPVVSESKRLRARAREEAGSEPAGTRTNCRGNQS